MTSGPICRPVSRDALQLISLIVPPLVVTAATPFCSTDVTLSADEEACIANAVPARRQEFAAGRHCARTALAALGIHEFSLLPGVGREPVWPAGVVGSITHSSGLCAAAVAKAEQVPALGIDIERERALDDDLVPSICTPREQSMLARFDGDAWATIVFSAKESVYKAYFPATRFALEFHGLEIDLEPRAGTFEATIVDPKAPAIFGSRMLPGRFARTDGYVCTAVAVRSPGGLDPAHTKLSA